MEYRKKRRIANLVFWSVWLLASAALMAQVAMAGERLAVSANPRWKAECGSCHLAYPPQLLPAQSWRRLMSQLDRHFGVDASLEPALAAEIGMFLERHAGSGRRAQDPAQGLRITQTPWFIHEHGRPRSAADCGA